MCAAVRCDVFNTEIMGPPDEPGDDEPGADARSSADKEVSARTKVAHDAVLALRPARHADVAAVQDQPVVGAGL